MNEYYVSIDDVWSITAKLHSGYLTIEQEQILKEMEEMIDKIPAADVRTDKPETWIPIDDTTWECSCCGRYIHTYRPEVDYWFCPNCGADMRAEEQKLKPPEVETMECFQCGGTVEIVQSKYNGHKHGHCRQCGMRFME